MTKQEFRAALKEKRNALPKEQKKEADRAITERIAASAIFSDASAVLLYAPIGSEPNLLPLVRRCRELGKTVAFPRCNTEDKTLQFYILTPDARLEKGAYGIPEPPADAPLLAPDERTLCIVPALSFDPQGNRIGYGAGYYDRFLSTFSGVTAGAAYETMLSTSLPVEEHDRPVSFVFTERGTIACEKHQEREKADRQAKNSSDKPTPWAALRNRFTSLVKRLGSQRSMVPATGETAPKRVSALHAPPILAAVCYLLLLLSRPIDTLLTDRGNQYAIVILLQVLIFLIPAILYVKLRSGSLVRRMRLQLPRLRHTWFLFCMLIVMITGGLLTEIATGGIASLTGSFTLYDTFVASSSGSVTDILALVLAYGILPAFCEELIFRAILCTEYESYGAAVAIGASALLFACLHFSMAQFPTYLLLGALLACVMYATRSFFAVFFLHLFYNLFCLFGQPFLSAFYVNAGSNELFLFCLGTVLLLFAAFAAGEARKIYHVYARKNLDSSHTPALPLAQLPRTFLFALLSPATAACLLIWLLASII